MTDNSKSDSGSVSHGRLGTKDDASVRPHSKDSESAKADVDVIPCGGLGGVSKDNTSPTTDSEGILCGG